MPALSDKIWAIPVIMALLAAIKPILAAGGLIIGGITAHQVVTKFTDYRIIYYWDTRHQQALVDKKLHALQNCVIDYTHRSKRKYRYRYYKL